MCGIGVHTCTQAMRVNRMPMKWKPLRQLPCGQKALPLHIAAPGQSLCLAQQAWRAARCRAGMASAGIVLQHIMRSAVLSLHLSGAGGCHAHNVGVSLLAALNMRKGWAADSEDQYVQLAIEAAADVGSLAALRADLRAHILASPLCDAPGFTEQLEAVYRHLWRETPLRAASSGGGDVVSADAASGAAAVAPAAQASS